jgi:hypothetical protein
VAVIPSTDNGLSSKSATFGGLTPGTVYSSITATAQLTLASGIILSATGTTQSTSVVAPEVPTVSSTATSVTTTSFTLPFTPGTGAGEYTFYYRNTSRWKWHSSVFYNFTPRTIYNVGSTTSPNGYKYPF